MKSGEMFLVQSFAGDILFSLLLSDVLNWFSGTIIRFVWEWRIRYFCCCLLGRRHGFPSHLISSSSTRGISLFVVY
jgi:hypothetical protein